MPGPDDAHLRRRLHARAGPNGTVAFDDYMDVVLYDPDHGYYATRADRAGLQGDFLTAPEVTPLFGAVVHGWVQTQRAAAGGGAFHVVEIGAGRGTLAQSLLAAAHARGQADGLHLHLVERGCAPRRELERRFAHAVNDVTIHSDVAELPPRLGAGCLLANELFDNLPVRRVMQAGGLKEVRLRVTPKRIREVLEDAPPDLAALVAAHGVRLLEGQSAEICPGAAALLEAVLSRFDAGAFLVFDYGGQAHEVSGEAAPHGTLAAHHGHVRHGDLYVDLGGQDVTAHVNFTPLIEVAARLGFADARLVPQGSFLVEHGLAERFLQRVQAEPDDLARLRLTQLAKQIYHPEAMGTAFLAFTGSRFPRDLSWVARNAIKQV